MAAVATSSACRNGVAPVAAAPAVSDPGHRRRHPTSSSRCQHPYGSHLAESGRGWHEHPGSHRHAVQPAERHAAAGSDGPGHPVDVALLDVALAAVGDVLDGGRDPQVVVVAHQRRGDVPRSGVLGTANRAWRSEAWTSSGSRRSVTNPATSSARSTPGAGSTISRCGRRPLARNAAISAATSTRVGRTSSSGIGVVPRWDVAVRVEDHQERAHPLRTCRDRRPQRALEGCRDRREGRSGQAPDSIWCPGGRDSVTRRARRFRTAGHSGARIENTTGVPP